MGVVVVSDHLIHWRCTMQSITIPAALETGYTGATPNTLRSSAESVHTIHPQKLINLDFGMFQSLCRLGTSRERICSALNISNADYDYLRGLSGN